MVLSLVQGEGQMSISNEGWKELVTMLESLDDYLLDKLDFEIWAIQMERRLAKEEEQQAEGDNILQFKRKE